MAHNNIAKFSISTVGDRTGEKRVGDFTSKVFLSQREECLRDAIRREKLGFNPQHADVLSGNIAAMVSELSVRITDGPAWWKGSDSGLDLVDTNLLREVYEKAMSFEIEAFAAIKKRGEAAKTELLQTKE